MNDQFNYKEIAEEQCNRRYHTEMWKDERVQVLKERAELLAENERLKSLLTDWQEFGHDIRTIDCAGQDALDGLNSRTQAALEQKP
jgi:hypothetical protein